MNVNLRVVLNIIGLGANKTDGFYPPVFVSETTG